MTDYFEIIIIEIPKVVKAYKKTPNYEVLQWMLFLDNPEKEEVARIMEENKDIKEAKEELERISQDDILRRKALNRSKRKRLIRWNGNRRENWNRKRKKGCNKKVI